MIGLLDGAQAVNATANIAKQANRVK